MNARARTLLVSALMLAMPGVPAWAQEAAPTSTAAAEARRIRQEAARLEAIAAAEDRDPEPREIDFGAQLLRSFLMLGAVVVFTYLVLGKGLPRLMRLTPGGRRVMIGVETRGLVEVVDRLPLEPRRLVYVLKVGNSHFLVASAEQGMTTLAKLENEDIEAAQDAAEKAAKGSGLTSGLLGRLGKKEGQS